MKSIYKLAMVLTLIFTIVSVSAQGEKITTKSTCRIFSDVDNISSVQGYIPKGMELEVEAWFDDYILVTYEDVKGYIRIDKTDGEKYIKVWEEEQALAQKQNPQQGTDRFSILTQKYGYKTGRALYEHKIWKGINTNAVKDSWGKPLNVKREIKKTETLEIWTYRKSWLAFKDGLLFDWGPNR